MSEAAPAEPGEGGNDRTIMGGDGGEPAPATPQTWPDTWREDMLGGKDYIASNDSAKKELDRLQRISSPGDMYKSYRELESKFSKIEPRIEFDSEMPDDKMSKWREQEGIPATNKDYKLEFEDGLVVGEEDKPAIDGFVDFAHKNNMPESHVKSAVKWYLESQIAGDEERKQKISDSKHETLSLLKAEYGSEFKGNINAMNELYVDHPEIKDVLMSAIGSDGLPIGNNEQVVRWAIDLAKKVNPAATVILPGGESGVKGLESRIKEIESFMRSDSEAYYHDQSMQKEYEDLLDKRERIKS